MRAVILSGLSLMVLGAWALGVQAADVENGEALHEQECISCHAGIMEGDPNDIYTRPNRRIQNRAALARQVARCEVAAEAKWFDDQRADVVEYLNQRFYHFK